MNHYRRQGFGTIEFLVVLALVVILAVLILPAIYRSREASSRRACVDNLLQLGLALRMYATETPGGWMPPLRAVNCDGEAYPALNFMFDVELMFPDYLSDLDQLVCPSSDAGSTAMGQWDRGKTTNPNWKKTAEFSGDGRVQPCEIVAQPYYYYGWAFSAGHFQGRWKDQLEKSFQALAETVVELGDTAALGQDMMLPEPVRHRDRIPRLHEGVARFFITDSNNVAGTRLVQSEIILMHDAFIGAPARLNHKPSGGNILYLDGHLEHRRWWPEYVELFPYNEAGLALHRIALAPFD